MDGSFEAYRHCDLCPRRCGVDRTAGQTGFCGETDRLRVAAGVAHFGEEPPISGTRGSGTMFLSGCGTGCCFCQNWQISHEHAGRELSAGEWLADAERLIAAGVHNLNFVTPDHFWPHIERLCAELRARGHALPFVFNSSGYHLSDRIPAYARSVDIFLPDFKFADAALARRVMGDADYPRLALEALRVMVAEKGFLDPCGADAREPARRGVLVRHLVLPGEAENSVAALRLLRGEFGKFLPLSVMSQYRPIPACAGDGAFGRRLTRPEYDRVLSAVAEAGFEQVFIQERGGDDEFTPDFNRADPFPGNARGNL